MLFLIEKEDGYYVHLKARTNLTEKKLAYKRKKEGEQRNNGKTKINGLRLVFVVPTW